MHLRFLTRTGRYSRIHQNFWKRWKLVLWAFWRSWTSSKKALITNPFFWKMGQNLWISKNQSQIKPISIWISPDINFPCSTFKTKIGKVHCTTFYGTYHNIINTYNKRYNFLTKMRLLTFLMLYFEIEIAFWVSRMINSTLFFFIKFLLSL